MYERIGEKENTRENRIKREYDRKRMQERPGTGERAMTQQVLH